MPLFEQSPLENESTTACADHPFDHPAVLAEKAEGRALLEMLPLGAPQDSAESQALYLCTNGDVLLGRATNGVCPCPLQPAACDKRREIFASLHESVCKCQACCSAERQQRTHSLDSLAFHIRVPAQLVLGCAPGSRADKLLCKLTGLRSPLHHARSDARLV